MDLFEAMETCRSIRKLKPDPIPDEVLTKLVYYATRAASAGNAQLWRFLIVTDPDDRLWFRDMLYEKVRNRFEPGPADEDDSQLARNIRMYRNFIVNYHQIPAFIMTLVENAYPPSSPTKNPMFMWSTVFPATQNLLLAARGMGLGAAMTTHHMEDEPAVRQRFGIPDNWGIGATIPLGYPIGKYGPLNRRPVEEVIFRNRFGQT